MKRADQRVLQKISQLLCLRPQLFSSDARLKEDLQLADWEHTLLINQLERMYKVEVTEEELPQLRTMQALVQHFLKQGE